MIEVKYLKLIRTIAEEGNIVNAAKRLYLTQSALSHQLKEVESQLCCKVFIRSRNHWRLTPEGEELYDLADSILNEIDQRLQKIKGIRQGIRGEVRVSTECYTVYHQLPSFIHKMRIQYPELDIHLNVEATHQPIEKLLANELDIAITSSRPRDDSLEYLPLFQDELFALIHEENDLASKPYLDADDFLHQNLLIHSYPLSTVSVYRHFLKPNQIHPEKITAIPLTEITLEWVQANMGIFCIPKWALDAFHTPDNVRFLRLGMEGHIRNHYLVYPKSVKDKQYIHYFINNLLEEFAPDKPNRSE